MKIYDLSHKLNNQMPVFPGTAKPQFKPAASIKKDGYRETLFNFGSHVGTHIDAPAHIFENGPTLDQLPVLFFTGKAIIIKVTKNTPFIEKSLLVPFMDKIEESDFVMFKTGWCHKWGSENYFSDFPVLTEETANWLISFKLRGIGFDAISADSVESTRLKVHQIILGKGLIIIENLNFPEKMDEKQGEFSFFPIPYENADGSPVRAILQVK